MRLVLASARRREAARLRGKHGATRNCQVLSRRRAPHRAGHACRVIILPTRAFVHVGPALTSEANDVRGVCFFAPAAAPRSSSVVVAIAGRVIAPEAAACGLGGGLAIVSQGRLNYPSKNATMMGILACQMLPTMLVIISIFPIFARVGLYNTLVGLVLVFTA